MKKIHVSRAFLSLSILILVGTLSCSNLTLATNRNTKTTMVEVSLSIISNPPPVYKLKKALPMAKKLGGF